MEKHLVLMLIAALAGIYVLMSIRMAIYLKQVNPDGAFDDISFFKLMIIWPKYFHIS